MKTSGAAQPATSQKAAGTERAPSWFWAAMALGAAVRLYLAIFTQGTKDVEIWRAHAQGVQSLGLIGYYHFNPLANHPPFISMMVSLLLAIANGVGIPFRVLLRLPFAAVDAATTALLVSLLGARPSRYWAGACYWLNPLALIFSAYHGNTDCAVACSLLGCVWCFSRGNTVAAGMALGMGFWIKLPGVAAIPALLLLTQNGRDALKFLAAAGATALVGFLPALALDPQVIVANVLGYHGQLVQTTGRVAIWGSTTLLLHALPQTLHDRWYWSFVPVVFATWQIGLVLMAVLAFLRRSRRSVEEVCATIGAGYAVLFGVTDYWAFQYFAWALPFWFFCPKWFALGAIGLGSAYIYSLYWTLCGNPWLLGQWDFIGHPSWPPAVVALRDAAVLFFASTACWFLFAALAANIKRRNL